ncbi:MAG: histidine phosphatase family protein [bacterium]|nr:histidine phosphatase family protein [bacterium]
MKLYFIRHGQTEANVEGILTGTIETNLTQEGIDDAKKLAKSLTMNFDNYYCSPLKRTHQTLKAIKGDANFEIDSRIIEVSSGKWQGLYKDELPKEEYDMYKKGLMDPPEGESLEDEEKRAKDFLDDMFKKYTGDENILVVTHNAFMRTLKRLFEKSNVEEPKNLEIYEVTEEMYHEMNNTKENKELEL